MFPSYIVPDYQREYVWNDEQVEQLMADLLDAYNTDNKKAYFLGTIVTYDSGSRFELIDGQQRLTTFFVLLCAIKKIYVRCGEQTSVIENLIYSPTMNSEGDVINSYHLQLHNDVYANKSKAYKQSKFYLTSSLSELVNQGHDTAINRTNSLLSSWSDWNKQSIEERQEMLYRLSEMIWEMS